MSRFAIRAMTAEDARDIAAWRYPEPYDFYDSDRDPGDLALLLDPAGWGVQYFAADDLTDRRLAGFFQFKVSDDVVEIGLGLRPDLTGQGLGESLVATGLEFAGEKFPGRDPVLAVAA